MLIRLDDVLASDILHELQGISIDDFVGGHSTGGIDATAVKKNLQLPWESSRGTELGQRIIECLSSNPRFVHSIFPRQYSVPLFSAYTVGMEYGLHVDNGIMMGRNGLLRSDIAMTIFLTDPATYAGGELVIEDNGLGYHRIKLPAGSAFAYPATTLHRVDRVTQGCRRACVIWIHSQIRDPGHRRVLVDLDIAAGHIRTRDPASPELPLVTAAYNNLIRCWADI